MIKMLKGFVVRRDEYSVTIVPEGCGIGFDVAVVQPALFESGKTVELYTHMHWNQENGPSMYGFSSAQERDFFVLIIGCSGIGPKIALAILEQIDIADFVRAIQTGDGLSLSKLKGIGLKKAEQLILQLKNKIDSFSCAQEIKTSGAHKHVKQLSDVLQSLSYSRVEIQQAVTHVRETVTDETIAFEVCLRKALLFLSQRV